MTSSPDSDSRGFEERVEAGARGLHAYETPEQVGWEDQPGYHEAYRQRTLAVLSAAGLRDLLERVGELERARREEREAWSASVSHAQRRAEAAEARCAELAEALGPLADLAEAADKYGHGSGSTSLWRLAYDDIVRAHSLLASSPSALEDGCDG